MLKRPRTGAGATPRWRQQKQRILNSQEQKPAWISWGTFFSATRRVIDRRKWGQPSAPKASMLVYWNWGWFLFELFVAAVLLAWPTCLDIPTAPSSLLFYLLLIALAFWRINEVVYAFWRDSLDKLQGTEDSSALTAADRMAMLARSGAGLIVWFAVTYFIASLASEGPLSVFSDALYFSALTLLGIGQEGLEITFWVTRALHVWQAAAGIVLLVVAISVYLGERRDT